MSGASELATRTVLDHTVLFGLEELACGMPAFVHCTADSLTGEWVQVLAPDRTIIELQSSFEPAPSLITACRKLKRLGFRLALDDYTGRPGSKSLVDLADYIKLDMARLDASERDKLMLGLEGISAQRIAKNVETQAEFRQACAEGFTLFQGYYFCHPEPLKNHKIQGNHLVHLEILEDLQSDPVDLSRLSELVMRDASLAYRLLRLVNSPVCGQRQEVTSILSALMLVGETTFRRMAMLAISTEFNANQPKEILRMAFERGRFCESAAGLCGLDASEQYLIGMVSLFPAMLRILMQDLVPVLPLREAARDALLGNGNREGILLRWLQFHDHGDWPGCERISESSGMRADQLMQRHAEAVRWAEAALKSTA